MLGYCLFIHALYLAAVVVRKGHIWFTVYTQGYGQGLRSLVYRSYRPMLLVGGGVWRQAEAKDSLWGWVGVEILFCYVINISLLFRPAMSTAGVL